MRREAHRLRFAARALHGEPRHVEALALQDRRHHELAFPAGAILRHEPPDGFVLAAIAPGAFQGGRDVFDDGFDAERLGNQVAERERVVRRVALRHEQAEHLVFAQRPRAKRSHYRAVDTT